MEKYTTSLAPGGLTGCLPQFYGSSHGRVGSSIGLGVGGLRAKI
jgi:hypothetical protein